MTTAEITAIGLANRMTDSELFDFQEKLKRLVARRKEKQFLKPLSKKELAKILSKSRVQAEQGKTITREVARERVRARYGI
ncbi:hypothetical protein IJ103_00300 [Candidatus Saccharibacteria bacterium]|nr:hypothetical protein [Candidatus Saccharibacteria bacterium]MBQ9016674.1 hypothetical protein [Candidatus Saccharibacteria bacterium]